MKGGTMRFAVGALCEKLWTAATAYFRAVPTPVASSRALARRPAPSHAHLAAVRGLVSRAARPLVVLLVAGVAGVAGVAPAAVAGEGVAEYCADVPADAAPEADGQCVEAGATADEEPVAEVQQPGPSDPYPAYDSITGLFGGSFLADYHYEPREDRWPEWRLDPSVTLGGGHLYVATGSSGALYGAGVYMYSTGEGCPNNSSAPAGALCAAKAMAGTWRPSGITYYRAKIYVASTDLPSRKVSTLSYDYDHRVRSNLVGRVTVLAAASLSVERQYKTPSLVGLDAAWGELWGRVNNTGYSLDVSGVVPTAAVDYFAILDPATGALRGAAPVGVAAAAAPFERDGNAKDVAISPEIGVVSSGSFSMHRTNDQALAAADAAAWTRTPFPDTLADALTGDPTGCYYNEGVLDSPTNVQIPRGSPVGADAPWGMRWLVEIAPCSRGRITESALTLSGTEPLQTVERTARRTWEAKPEYTGQYGGYDSSGIFDVAYQASEPRITWSGKPTEPTWQHGTHTLTYFVNDGEYYIVGGKIQRWFDPANGFQNVVLKATSTDAAGQPTGAPIDLGTSTAWMGTFTINEDDLPSGTYQLTMTATIGGGKTVTKTNPNFRVDHSPPTGTLDGGLPAATNTTVNATGALGDAHSGPARWNFQVNGPGTGGNFQTVCTATAADPSTGKWGCPWNTNANQEGTYQVRALLEDQVQPAYGSANTLPVGNGTVIVDRTAPSIGNTAPDLYEDGYEIARAQVSQVRWTQTDNLSGIASTTIEVNASNDGSDSGAWATAGSSSTPGDTSTMWDTGDRPGGLYQFRARSCDNAANCSDDRWQGEVASEAARRRARQCQSAPYCYASRFAGRGLFFSSFGNGAVIATPGRVRWQDHSMFGLQQHTAVYVDQGSPYPEVQTGITTDCGRDNPVTINGKRYDEWGRYVEFIDRGGTQYFQCFGTSPQDDASNFRVAIRNSQRAKAFINSVPRVIRNDAQPSQINGWKKRGYYITRDGLDYTQATGEVSNQYRQLGGRFSSWVVAFSPGSFTAPTSVTPKADPGYTWNSASPTQWCVVDAARSCSP
jgi:hypothetical protein